MLVRADVSPHSHIFLEDIGCSAVVYYLLFYTKYMIYVLLRPIEAAGQLMVRPLPELALAWLAPSYHSSIPHMGGLRTIAEAKIN